MRRSQYDVVVWEIERGDVEPQFVVEGVGLEAELVRPDCFRHVRRRLAREERPCVEAARAIAGRDLAIDQKRLVEAIVERDAPVETVILECGSRAVHAEQKAVRLVADIDRPGRHRTKEEVTRSLHRRKVRVAAQIFVFLLVPRLSNSASQVESVAEVERDVAEDGLVVRRRGIGAVDEVEFGVSDVDPRRVEALGVEVKAAEGEVDKVVGERARKPQLLTDLLVRLGLVEQVRRQRRAVDVV